MVSRRVPFRISAIALLANLALPLCYGVTLAHAGPAQNLMEKSIPSAEKQKSSSSLAALTSSNATIGIGSPKNKNAGSGGEGGGGESLEIDGGGNNYQFDQLAIAPLKGMRQLADSQPIQKMYKDLLTKSVPVLFQTMMMVENGAGTGFAASMNAVSSLESNLVETQRFSMELMDMTDVTGQLKYAYAGRIHQAFESGEVDSWPAALYVASGDAAQGDLGDFDELPDTSAPFTLDSMPEAESGSSGTPQDELKFVEQKLMTQKAAEAADPEKQHSNQDLEALRKEYIDLVGDWTIKAESVGTDKLQRRYKVQREKGEKQEERRGFERRQYEESKQVWESILKLLNKVCEFKVNNANNSREPTQKQLSAQATNWDADSWKDASAPDILMTENLLQQLFMLSKPSKELQDITCSDEYPERVIFPFDVQFSEASSDEPDACHPGGVGEGEPRPCNRYIVVNKMAIIIGTSRALHTYDALDRISQRFALDEDTLKIHKKIFAEVLGEGEIGILIDQNRDDWLKLTLTLAKYLQGLQGGGANFRPESNNAIPNQHAGRGERNGG